MDTITYVCPNCKKVNRLPKKDSYKKANCGGCRASLLDGKVLEATDNDFNYIIQNATVPVIVDFWAPWCGPCKMMAPAFEEASRELAPKAQFVKLNTEENPQTASAYGIRSIPTIIPEYAVEIANLLQIFCPWAFIKNHHLTFGLSSNFLQIPKNKVFAKSKAILLHNPGL